jgi:hypothetical protein
MTATHFLVVVVSLRADAIDAAELSHVHEKFRSGMGGLSSGDESFEVVCACDEAHPKTPAGKSGCGARFLMRVAWP